MKVEVEEISSIERRLEVEIPAERVRDEFEKTLKVLGRQARIKGFRPGRAPRAVLERYFAEDLRQQVTSTLVQEGFSEALEQSKLDIVSQPQLDIGSVKDKESLKFSARVEIRPDMSSIDTAGLSGERPMVDITDANVDEVLGRLRERFAELVPVEERTDIERGDFANVKLSATLEGDPVAGLQHDSATVVVAAGRLPQAVDERLSLARVGDTFSLEAPAPDGAPPELEGKTLEYTIVVNSISEKVMPTLDDDFAKDHGDCESLEELRGKIREQLEQDAQRRADMRLRETVLSDFLGKNPVELPPSLVQSRIESLLQEFKYELASQGMQLTSSEFEEEARGNFRERAEKDVAADLLLDRLATDEGIEIGEEELAERIGNMLAGAGAARDRLREHYDHGHARDGLRAQMRKERTLERLVSRADVKEVKNVEAAAEE
jgi:trigger factor